MLLKKELFLNLLIAFIPIAFIAGNLFINLNVLLIILFSLFFFRLKIFKEKFTNIDKLLLIFFLYISINGIINDYLKYDNSNIVLIKSLSYLRFLILYFILKFFVRKNIINFRYFFCSSGAACFFVVVDIIIQYTFKQDLFGYVVEQNQRVLSGPFGDEYIAGSFIQRFYIFGIYFILLLSNFKKSRFFYVLTYFSLIFLFFGSLLAGNRIPSLLFVLILILFFLFEKSFRKQSLVIFSIFFIIMSLNLNFSKNLTFHYSAFVERSMELTKYLSKRLTNEKLDYIPNSYAKEIETGILVWQQNKLVGGGVKSFYFNCVKIKNSVMDKTGGTNCSSHPHNYYLQISNELGLIGLFMSIAIFLAIIIKSLRIILSSKNIDQIKILIPFFIVFIAEIFPLKTTGSFFTSANSTFLFIIIAFIIGIIQLKEKPNYE